MLGLFNFYKKDREKKIIQLKEFIEKETKVSLIDLESQLEEIDGIVLSGSERLITEGEHKEEWLEFIRHSNIPIIGICFGFQLICQAFGAVFEHGENIKKSIEVKKLRKHPLFNGIPATAILPESHEEYVIAIMNPLIPLMLSDSCIEAIVHQDKPIYGTQFHFERSKEYGNIILNNFLNIIKYNRINLNKYE